MMRMKMMILHLVLWDLVKKRTLLKKDNHLIHKIFWIRTRNRMMRIINKEQKMMEQQKRKNVFITILI
jgi:hypothetical protein